MVYFIVSNINYSSWFGVIKGEGINSPYTNFQKNIFLVHHCIPHSPVLVCNLENGLSVRNVPVLFHFVKPPSDTVHFYFKKFYLMPSPSSLQLFKGLTPQNSPSSGHFHFILIFKNVRIRMGRSITIPNQLIDCSSPQAKF